MEETEFGSERPDQPADWRQLGVLVLDGSISMTWEIEELEELGITGPKATAVNTAVRDLFTRFKVSRKKKNFTFAVVKFHEYVTEEIPPTPVTEIDDYGNYDPTSAGTGTTFIGSGLERAKEICEQFFADHADDLPTTAVVLLLTDGECSKPERTKDIATELKKNGRIKLAASYLATKNKPQHGVGLLRAICSEPVDLHFKLAYDPDALRDFWTRSLQ